MKVAAEPGRACVQTPAVLGQCVADDNSLLRSGVEALPDAGEGEVHAAEPGDQSGRGHGRLCVETLTVYGVHFVRYQQAEAVVVPERLGGQAGTAG